MQITTTNHRQQGFTLIELSIVLVIIGLIVGGVLVGQDLIKQAQIRATITQLQGYNAAVNSFHAKYNGFPGDLVNPANYFATTNSAGTTGLADGNGLIESTAAANEDGETTTAWYMLNQSNLEAEAKGDSDYTGNAGANVLPGQYLPQTKFGRASIAFRSGGGQNYWEMGTWSGKENAAALAAGLTPAEALAIDNKLDDGQPGTGTVLAISTVFATPQTYTANGHNTVATLVAGDCEYTGATGGDAYATAVSASANAIGCTLSIRGSY